VSLSIFRTGSTARSPYLADSSRLGDVIAAIQAMATYKFYKLPFDGWADRITADKSLAGKWEAIFLEHPEFFRLDSSKTKASLVWRRQFPKRFDVDAFEVITKQQYDQLTDSKRERISRIPLTAVDIKALVDTAVNLHARAPERQRESRWWVPVLVAAVGFAGSLIGAFIGASLKGQTFQ
jgi:hypothetical protein